MHGMTFIILSKDFYKQISIDKQTGFIDYLSQ